MREMNKIRVIKREKIWYKVTMENEQELHLVSYNLRINKYELRNKLSFPFLGGCPFHF